MSTYTSYKVYKRGVKDDKGNRKTCRVCGRVATVLAFWKLGNGFKGRSRYCEEHAREMGVFN